MLLPNITMFTVYSIGHTENILYHILTLKHYIKSISGMVEFTVYSLSILQGHFWIKFIQLLT